MDDPNTDRAKFLRMAGQQYDNAFELAKECGFSGIVIDLKYTIQVPKPKHQLRGYTDAEILAFLQAGQFRKFTASDHQTYSGIEGEGSIWESDYSEVVIVADYMGPDEHDPTTVVVFEQYDANTGDLIRMSELNFKERPIR